MIRATLILAACLILTGCTPPRLPPMQPSAMLPPNALAAKEGVGRLWFQATDDGVIYVYDCDTADVILSTPILKNQRFILDPQNKLATVEGKPVFEKEIDKNHTHRIYLDPHGTPPKPTTQGS